VEFSTLPTTNFIQNSLPSSIKALSWTALIREEQFYPAETSVYRYVQNFSHLFHLKERRALKAT
jgi:hypothetical protein